MTSKQVLSAMHYSPMWVVLLVTWLTSHRKRMSAPPYGSMRLEKDDLYIRTGLMCTYRAKTEDIRWILKCRGEPLSAEPKSCGPQPVLYVHSVDDCPQPRIERRASVNMPRAGARGYRRCFSALRGSKRWKTHSCVCVDLASNSCDWAETMQSAAFQVSRTKKLC